MFGLTIVKTGVYLSLALVAEYVGLVLSFFGSVAF